MGTRASDTATLSTIVVATDFSETAERAYRIAVELAVEHRASLLIVHAISMHAMPAGGPTLLTLPDDFEERVREGSIGVLESLATSARERGVEASAELDDGPAAQTVIDVAREHRADLIVTGTRGLTGFRHLLLGSVAEELVRNAPCPVLAIHPADTDIESAAQSLSAPHCVVVASDFSASAEHAADAFASIFARGEGAARVILAHAYHAPVPLAPLSGVYPAGSVLLPDAAEVSGEALEPLAERLRARGFEVEIAVSEGNAAAVLTEIAADRSADLIVVGTRGITGLEHTLLGSTAERVLQHAPCPVLCVGGDGA